MLNDSELCNRRQVCEQILRTAGIAARDRFLARDFKSGKKGAQDFVSEVDRATEQTIKSSLKHHFPTDEFLGEEEGGALGKSTWIVDPIDGTSNFVRGIPYWCLSAALVVKNQTLIGIIYDPMRDEMYSCHKGAGSTLNNTSIAVATTRSPQDAVLGISFNFQNSKNEVGRVVGDLISNGTSFRMMGAGALSLAHCAAGHTDGFWEAFMKPWDAAAGLALIAEAGGIVCDYGRGDGFANGNPVLGTTPALGEYFSQLTGIPLLDSAERRV